MIDCHFLRVDLASSQEKVFDPEQLLSQIIDKMRADVEDSKKKNQ